MGCPSSHQSNKVQALAHFLSASKLCLRTGLSLAQNSNCGPRTGHQVQPPSPFLPGTDPALSPITSCLKNCTTGERKPEMNSHFGARLGYRKEEYNIQSKRKAKEENCSPVPSPGFTLLHPVLVNTRCINNKFKKLYLR